MNANGASSVAGGCSATPASSHIGTSAEARCPWTACSASPALRTEEETKAHLEEHWTDMFRQWSGASKCSWPKCSSKATFKFPKLLKTHISNIHINPLVCTVPQCSYTKPFGKQYELDRHISTVHGEARNHRCPIESCEAGITGFARKDKLLNHMREQHDNLRCPYNHCSATVLKTQEESHLQQFHGSFECALGICEQGLASRFREVDLQRHIRKHHGLTYDPAQKLMKRVNNAEDKTARGSLLTSWRWQDCPICSKQQYDARLKQNSEDINVQMEQGTF